MQYRGRRLGASVLLVTGIVFLPVIAMADNPGPYYWKQGEPPHQMAQKSQHFCYINSIGGRFSGFGERVTVSIDQTNTWNIGGTGQTGSVTGGVECIPLSVFKLPPGGVVWTSEKFSLQRVWNGSKCLTTPKAPAWWGDAATAVTEVTGSFRGKGEAVGVQQSQVPWQSSQFYIRTCQKQIGVGGYSLFAGVPHSDKPTRFIGPNGVGSIVQAGEWVSKPNGDVLLKTNGKAFCYFSEISGTFNGPSESLSIRFALEGGNRILRARHGSGDGTYAKVRCMAYDQS